MKQTTNLALDCHTIEYLINCAKAMGDLGELFIRKLLKPQQKRSASVAAGVMTFSHPAFPLLPPRTE